VFDWLKKKNQNKTEKSSAAGCLFLPLFLLQG